MLGPSPSPSSPGAQTSSGGNGSQLLKAQKSRPHLASLVSTARRPLQNTGIKAGDEPSGVGRLRLHDCTFCYLGRLLLRGSHPHFTPSRDLGGPNSEHKEDELASSCPSVSCYIEGMESGASALRAFPSILKFRHISTSIQPTQISRAEDKALPSIQKQKEQPKNCSVGFADGE